MVRIAHGDIPNKFPEGINIKIIFSIFSVVPTKKYFFGRKKLASRAIRAIGIYYIIIPKDSQMSTD